MRVGGLASAKATMLADVDGYSGDAATIKTIRDGDGSSGTIRATNSAVAAPNGHITVAAQENGTRRVPITSCNAVRRLKASNENVRKPSSRHAPAVRRRDKGDFREAQIGSTQASSIPRRDNSPNEAEKEEI